MSQVSSIQEIRRSNTSPTWVPTPTPVDSPSNIFSPAREESSSIRVGTQWQAQTMTQDVPPTFLPHAESTWDPSWFGARDKGKRKEPTSPTPIPPHVPSGSTTPHRPTGPPGGSPPSPSPSPGPAPPPIVLPTPALVNSPNRREKGNKPQPFTNKSDFQTFRLAVLLYLLQNKNIYPTNKDKILFVLTLMTEGVPGQWMRLWMEKRLNRTHGYPTFDDFMVEF
jgi:hypothetical protein